MRLPLFLLVIMFLTCTWLTERAEARAKYLFKIASLAPEGSVWVEQFEKFGSEVTELTNGEVGFRIYPGGVMGDDQAMYRKMRVGQLHGGGFTMTGIASVVQDFRIMSIPFLFENYDEVDVVKSGLLPTFRQRFNEQGMEFIAFTEVGFIYTMSTQPIATIDELREATSWIPAGDPLAAGFLDSIGISPVQLTIPDVLSSLQTGLVDTVYNSLYGSIVLQWFNKARYVTDKPFGYAYGVFLLDQRRFSRLPDNYRKIIRDSAQKHFAVLIDQTRKSNAESREVMTQRGVTFVEPDEESLGGLQEYRDMTVDNLKGKAFSTEIHDQLMKILNNYRADNTSGN